MTFDRKNYCTRDLSAALLALKWRHRVTLKDAAKALRVSPSSHKRSAERMQLFYADGVARYSWYAEYDVEKRDAIIRVVLDHVKREGIKLRAAAGQCKTSGNPSYEPAWVTKMLERYET